MSNIQARTCRKVTLIKQSISIFSVPLLELVCGRASWSCVSIEEPPRFYRGASTINTSSVAEFSRTLRNHDVLLLRPRGVALLQGSVNTLPLLLPLPEVADCCGSALWGCLRHQPLASSGCGTPTLRWNKQNSERFMA